jgi:plasmid stabilization system protein ParE
MEMKVKWHPAALQTLQESFTYITEQSPQNARLVLEQLLDFGDNLSLFPDKFPLCKKSVLKRKKLHCVAYLNHIFIYGVQKNQLFIFNLVHASQHPKKLQVKKQ